MKVWEKNKMVVFVKYGEYMSKNWQRILDFTAPVLRLKSCELKVPYYAQSLLGIICIFFISEEFNDGMETLILENAGQVNFA